MLIHAFAAPPSPTDIDVYVNLSRVFGKSLLSPSLFIHWPHGHFSVPGLCPRSSASQPTHCHPSAREALLPGHSSPGREALLPGHSNPGSGDLHWFRPWNPCSSAHLFYFPHNILLSEMIISWFNFHEICLLPLPARNGRSTRTGFCLCHSL